MNGDYYFFIFVEERFVVILRNSIQFVQFLTVGEWTSISACTRRTIRRRSVRQIKKKNSRKLDTAVR